jgi:dihydroorotase
VQEKLLTPLQAVARLSSGPAAIAGLDAGTLAKGAAADLTLLDPKTRWTLRSDAMISSGRNTPFAGNTFVGQVSRTLYQGRSVFGR